MASDWPRFDVASDSPTFALLHLVSQMLGKLRVAYAPWENHGWHATLHPVAEGLATAPTAFEGGTFTLTLDLCRHALVLHVADGERDVLPLDLGSIAALHHELVTMLDSHGLPSHFHARPNEVPEAVRFAEDSAPRAYSEDSASRLHTALTRVEPVFDRFRAGFRGKVSPVHFFWGSFDLAVTRFSGRAAPPHPGGIPGLPDRITREAYSHEVSSAGFWLGGATPVEPMFYSYAYPAPLHFSDALIAPEEASFSAELGEFVLPYEAVRASSDPAAMLTEFLQSTYDIAADLGHWDRAALEREPVAP